MAPVVPPNLFPDPPSGCSPGGVLSTSPASSRPRPRAVRRRRTFWAGTAVALLAVTAAWTVAASLSVSPGATETGIGAYHPTVALTYFVEVKAGITTIPSAALASLSPAVATPTVLAGASAAYAINALTAGDVGQYWQFGETLAAPINTEVELQFWLSTGAGATHLTLYIETQASAPGTPLGFLLYFDLGSPSSGTITINSVMELSQQCSAVGTCP